MSSMTVGERILRRLIAWKVPRVYGYPGDGINGILGGWHAVENELEFIQTRHEELASFAACAHAKFTGQTGVCIATSGPGAVHLLNGLYDAKLDHQPVVAIIGQQARASMGADYQQEVDLISLYKDVAREYIQVLNVPAQTDLLIDRALRVAAASRSVTAIIVPNDVQEMEFSPPSRTHGEVYSSVGYRRPLTVPCGDDLEAAAKLLNEGEKVAMLIGQGAIGAAAEVKQAAEKLGCGVAKALNGKAAVADDLPYVTGGIGLLGTKPSNDMMEGCDTLLMVGTNFPYSEWLPEPGQARCVQIDIDGRLIGMRYPTEVPLVGDAAATLKELIPRLDQKQDRSWREQIEAGVQRWWKILEGEAHVSADPLNPQLVFHELSQHLPDRAILTSDSGSATDWWARHVKVREDMMCALSGTLATMCPGVPYSVAAKFAHPDRPVIAAIGDGAMQMIGLNSLIDIARYHDRWQNKTLVVCVLHNNDLNQVTWEQRVMSGDAKLEVSQTLPDFDYAGYARLLGLEGIRVESPDAVGVSWERALAADKPVLLEFITDPEVPPLPPHIRFEQAKGMAKALKARDPDSGHMIRESFKSMVQEFVNR